MEVKVKELLLQIKMQIQNKPGRGIRYLKVIFNRYDVNGNKKLDPQEFEECLNAFGLFFKKVELQALIKYYDVDGDGQINLEEFLRGLRDQLTERRENMVWRAFSLMDRDGSGKIEAADVYNLYDVSQHREFIEGTKTKDEILADFLNSFDGVKGNNDGIITKEEWYEYYIDLSVLLKLLSEVIFISHE